MLNCLILQLWYGRRGKQILFFAHPIRSCISNNRRFISRCRFKFPKPLMTKKFSLKRSYLFATISYKRFVYCIFFSLFVSLYDVPEHITTLAFTGGGKWEISLPKNNFLSKKKM